MDRREGSSLTSGIEIAQTEVNLSGAGVSEPSDIFPSRQDPGLFIEDGDWAEVGTNVSASLSMMKANPW